MTACTFCTPDAACACLIVLMTPRWLHEVRMTRPLPFSMKLVPISWEVVRNIISRILLRCGLVRKAAKSINNADFLQRIFQRPFKSALRNLSRGKGMVGDDGGTFRHHEQQARVEDCLTIERPVLAAV